MTIERTSPVNPVTGVQPGSIRDQVSSQGGQNTQSRVEKNPSPHSASVTLSDSQALLLQPATEEINAERVEALKKAIRNGELVMDTDKIADALIRDALELLQGN